jgi:hypothetical protein
MTNPAELRDQSIVFMQHEHRGGSLLADPLTVCTLGFWEHLAEFIASQDCELCPSSKPALPISIAKSPTANGGSDGSFGTEEGAAMDNQPTTSEALPATIGRAVMVGDLADLNTEQRAEYYAAVCRNLGLYPLTKPFEFLTLNGKLRLYALRDCTDQLRRLHGISIYIANQVHLGDIYIVTARARDRTGREDGSTGAVALGTLKGDALANALMKSETKAKRRVTLSVAGLGWLDETELETIPPNFAMIDSVG